MYALIANTTRQYIAYVRECLVAVVAWKNVMHFFPPPSVVAAPSPPSRPSVPRVWTFQHVVILYSRIFSVRLDVPINIPRCVFFFVVGLVLFVVYCESIAILVATMMMIMMMMRGWADEGFSWAILGCVLLLHSCFFSWCSFFGANE